MTTPPTTQPQDAPEPLDPFARIAQVFRRDIATYRADARIDRVNDVLSALISLPLAVIGITWLARVSDWTLIARNWMLLPLVIALIVLLSRWNFFLITDLGVRGGGWYGNVNSTVDGIIRWSAVFLFGPAVLWIVVLTELVLMTAANADIPQAKDRYWRIAQNALLTAAGLTLAPLIAFSAYTAWGGTFPISGLSFRNFLLGAGTMGIQLLLEAVMVWIAYLGYKLVYTLWQSRETVTRAMVTSIARMYLFSVIIPGLGNLFAALFAGLYVEHGFFFYLVFSLALLGVAWIGHQMSHAIEASRAQTAQIEKLEALGRAILNAPPDNSTLPDLMTDHAGPMFAYALMVVWLEPDRILFKRPESWDAAQLVPVRRWLINHPQPLAIMAQETPPWLAGSPGKKYRPALLAPILDTESGAPVGGIYLELASYGQKFSRHALTLMLPTIQSLGAQIASALHQSVLYERMLAHQKTQNELEFARRIQTGFLPEALPEVPGWGLFASLETAREMSGDFYDVIPLSEGRLGILIADVMDKGIGPALYMALSRTLLRTFATRFEAEPEKVFDATNERILQDALESLFVTAFYGILDPQTGMLTYANGGHNPPLLLRAADPQQPELLVRTGTPLGMIEGQRWKSNAVTIVPGDVLVLYTDGVTEAQDPANTLFGDDRLLEAARASASGSAPEIHTAILEAIRTFVAGAPQFDDITLVTLKRAP